ncbi:unnamed protein product, partial [Staurois parvus]
SLRHSRSPIHGKSRRCRIGHVISCVQSQLITYHQSTDDQGALMICVALSVPISASSQCSSMPPASAHQCHISATFQCPSVPHQCHISVPI